MVSELIATITRVWPSLPFARKLQTNTMAVQGAIPSKM
jgi:hypothetical protein